MSQNTVKLKDICISNDLPITLIAGPCVLENYDHAKMMVEKLLEITEATAFSPKFLPTIMPHPIA